MNDRPHRSSRVARRLAVAMGLGLVPLVAGAAVASAGAADRPHVVPGGPDLAQLPSTGGPSMTIALLAAMFMSAGLGIACAARGSQVRHHRR
ncbi:hypothetical protein [Desertimonas flava]|jgi:hypothetical protein|uniref:hypothetical protein n=1 Tax=Desertimonas flava TaxID=2064846 RepID=UPI0013C4B29E|nr:hypothetical protein [Desertimonas flava]